MKIAKYRTMYTAHLHRVNGKINTYRVEYAVDLRKEKPVTGNRVVRWAALIHSLVFREKH